jgi:hypothetical protein
MPLVMLEGEWFHNNMVVDVTVISNEHTNFSVPVGGALLPLTHSLAIV